MSILYLYIRRCKSKVLKLQLTNTSNLKPLFMSALYIYANHFYSMNE